MAEVLVIGNGGREAALEQAMSASEEVERVVVSNHLEAGLEQLSDDEKPFVVIGPEAPLVDGMADGLRGEGYTVFGVGADAAQYEASKSFAVMMMQDAGILHPATHIAYDFEDAQQYIRDRDPLSYVIKADGLAGGKGVVLPTSRKQAWNVTRGMMEGVLFDGAGERIVNFADRHSGSEVSAMVIVGDNDEFTILPIAQDHKRLHEGDKGPNTGGMGAYAPVPKTVLSDEQYSQLYESVEKTLAGMRSYGTPFERGLLYAGFMLSDQESGKPVVIEYNVRFGDPEAQVILPLVRSAGVDVYRLLRSAAEGSLEIPEIDFSRIATSALTVCLAAKGYPIAPEKGAEIWGLDEQYPNVTVQRAGVKHGKTSGGRVLYVSGTGETIDTAAEAAYAAIDLERGGTESGKIGFEGMQVRRDIGHQARIAAN
jgi:phosphoribosylamine---glycine ligase